ncbi:MAG: hypothetical protein ACLR23_16000 [Clostridia bacterium]
MEMESMMMDCGSFGSVAIVVIVKMEDMGLFDTAVNQSEFGGVADIRFWDKGRRVCRKPRSSWRCLRRLQRALRRWDERGGFAWSSARWLMAVVPCWHSGVRIDGRNAVFRIDFQLVVKEDGILPKSWFDGMIDIREHAAGERRASYRIVTMWTGASSMIVAPNSP